jgi:hypothetical protein
MLSREGSKPNRLKLKGLSSIIIILFCALSLTCQLVDSRVPDTILTQEGYDIIHTSISTYCTMCIVPDRYIIFSTSYESGNSCPQ